MSDAATRVQLPDVGASQLYGGAYLVLIGNEKWVGETRVWLLVQYGIVACMRVCVYLAEKR